MFGVFRFSFFASAVSTTQFARSFNQSSWSRAFLQSICHQIRCLRSKQESFGARATNGNGVGKGKGKKGKPDHVPQAMLSELNNATDPTEEIREEVRAVIPEAALLCSQKFSDSG